MARLPKFKDKVMFIGKENSSTKTETSYPVSASFKGIVRLSPNNYTSIYQKNNVSISSKQDSKMTSYSDAIVFQQGTNTMGDWDITNRLIVASQSDGYLLNFRLGSSEVEFDNLGVIGILQTKDLQIYSYNQQTVKNEETGEQSIIETQSQSFIINNTIMPCNANTIERSIANSDSDYDSEVDISGNGDNSYLLYTSPNASGDKREFHYKRTLDLLRDIIMETMLDLETVPTGSIHWFPVTYEQYNNLCKNNSVNNGGADENGKYHGAHNVSVQEIDPIIRDYILCDGSSYKNEDYPELAKILHGEKMWDFETKKFKYCLKYDAKNDGAQKEDDGTFCVPDLRDCFISYVYTKGLNRETNSIDASIYESDENENETGYYTPDNMPKSKDGSGTDKHFHFIAYGTYGWDSPAHNDVVKENGYLTYPFSQKSNDGDINSYTTNAEIDQKYIDSSSNPVIWYLYNHPWTKSYGFNGCHWGFGRAAHKNDQRPDAPEGSGAESFISAPAGGIKSYMREPDVGMSSRPYIICDKTTSRLWQPKVNENDNSQSTNTQTLVGNQATPKFYAMVPLIKI